MNFKLRLKEEHEHDHPLESYVWTLFGFSIISFLVYSALSLRLVCNTKNQIDSFSKKIITIYSIGFLIKTILWLLVALDLMGEQIKENAPFNEYQYI
jgi:hypothetical protein